MRKDCLLWLWLLSISLAWLMSSAEQQSTEHRIQRRFMWQQMEDSVVNSLVGRMFHGARAMKTMLSDLMPSTAAYTKSMMELVPTETTRVKYIIRNPHTNKPMKIIKMRPTSKKLVKLVMTPQSKPLHVTTTTTTTTTTKDTRMRQLEKEQELIAEGKLPMSSDDALLDKYFKQHPRMGSHSAGAGAAGGGSNQIVAGKILEYQSWRPVYRPGEQPTSFATAKPQALSLLHTNIAASNELLPKPEKLVGHSGQDSFEESSDSDDGVIENELAKQMNHKYEVTEHTGEESGERSVQVHAVASMESGFVPSKGVLTLYRPTIRSRGASSTLASTTTTTTTTSTTEAPNYPASFLKKYRERERAHELEREREINQSQSGDKVTTGKSSKRYQQPQHKDLHVIGWAQLPAHSNNASNSMSSLRARLQEQQRHNRHKPQESGNSAEEHAAMEAMMDAMRGGDKWPAEVQHSYVTVGPSAVAFMEAAATEIKLPKSEYKRPSVNLRERGTIKFGAKANYDEI